MLIAWLLLELLYIFVLTMESSKRDKIVCPSLIFHPRGYDCRDFLSAELLSIFDEGPETSAAHTSKANTIENPPAS